MAWATRTGLQALRELRFWRVATVIARVVEIVQRCRFVVILWISMIVWPGFLLSNINYNDSLLFRWHPAFECIICDVVSVSSSPLHVNMGITRLPSK